MTKPLNSYVASVTIEAETLENAEQVLAERLGYDEDYGFPYTLKYDDPQIVDNTKDEPLYHIEIKLLSTDHHSCNTTICGESLPWDDVLHAFDRIETLMESHKAIELNSPNTRLPGGVKRTLIPTSAIAWMDIEQSY